MRKTSALLGRLVGRGAVKVDGNGRSRLYSVGEPLHCIYYKLRRWRDEAAVVHGLIRFMVAFYGPGETEEILGSVLNDKIQEAVFLRAQDDLDSGFADLPVGGATATYRELVERHRDLGDPEWRIRVAGDLLDIGVRLAESGEGARSIEFNEELIRHFDSMPIPEVQASVAKAFLNKAVATQRVSDHEAAVSAFSAVVERFGESEGPDIQECVGAALLNTGFHHGRLGDPEAAMAAFDGAIGRFGESHGSRLRLYVAMSLRNKGSTLAGLGSPSSMDRGIATWDDLIDRFGDDCEPDIQVQVASALTKKAAAHMQMGRGEAAVAACEEAVRRYSESDELDLRRQVATALEFKAMILNQIGRGPEALVTHDALVREFGGIAGLGGIPVAWRAMGSRVHAQVLEGQEPAAARVPSRRCAMTSMWQTTGWSPRSSGTRSIWWQPARRRVSSPTHLRPARKIARSSCRCWPRSEGSRGGQ